MTQVALEFPTTYIYQPLRSPRHIRVLKITLGGSTVTDVPQPIYSLVQFELPVDSTTFDFEAISYAWGHHARVSHLHIKDSAGHIGLTANLTAALPHVTSHSRTRRLWIDQLCINQSDDAEKSIQVGLMSEIYKRAARVIIWLGPEDEHSRLCRQWLDRIDTLIPTMKSAKKITIGSPEYSKSWRMLILQDTFSAVGTDPIWAAAIGKFFGRMYFRRGWIVQEFLLPAEILCLAGDACFNLQNLEDLFTVPATDALSDATEGWLSYRVLLQLKTDPFISTPQPLRFLRIMAAVAQEFITHNLGDRLYGFLGMIEGLDFLPDYKTSVKENFTRFAATLARQYGDINFLSMWSANLDDLLKDTAPELLGLPSWVPSFSATPLSAPWRLAIAGARSWGTHITWNAAAGRHHTHDPTVDAALTNRLLVRGHIIDHIAHLSTTRIAKYWAIDEAYLTSLVAQIKTDLPGFQHWTHVEMVQFLHVVSNNGVQPREPAEQILGLVPGVLPDEHRHLTRHEDSLAIALTMGRGRRFMTTEEGRRGLAPFIGSRARDGEIRGSVIAVLHGCIVPIVLQRVDDGGEENGGEWKVVGDCYVEGVMCGEAVVWEEEDARSFTLV